MSALTERTSSIAVVTIGTIDRAAQP